jgi:flagellar basal body rod protein FlgC
MLASTTDAADFVECQRLAIASYSLMDQGRYEETVALFSKDAVWVRGGKPFEGHEAILAALRQRPDAMVSRHLVTNVLVERTGADAACATACFVPLRGDRREDGSVAMPAIESVGDLRFRFRREADGWRITHLEPQPLFKP